MLTAGVGTLGNDGPTDGDQLVDALNTLRAILVGCAFIAALMLGFDGQWAPAGILAAGIAAHFGLWAYLRADKRKRSETAALLDGTTTG
ncbi:hypothetical protein FTX61_05395 [Nitriliruptoraceae bacterium ZYF776]|nr:hypothetical protein [Profundirhabdus halotolerans]